MKNTIVSVVLCALVPLSSVPKSSASASPSSLSSIPVARNLVIITIDGFRWQELFTGADPVLVSDETVTRDTDFIKMLYWDDDVNERRKKLMPFFWNVLSIKGQLYGNRNFGNKVNVANVYSVSYPGYNEIFTGNADIKISSNRKRKNPNINVLEYLEDKPAFRGKVAAFTSWDVFPFIFNSERNNVFINSGYMDMEEKLSLQQELIGKVQKDCVNEKAATRFDQLTFLTAKEYLQLHHPKVTYIGLGETDEFAHQSRYDLYLEQANKIDKMIAELWHWVQTTEGYKDNTTFIITTDHGRGSRSAKWSSHGSFIKGSSQTWVGIIGPGISPTGEVKDNEQIYQAQLARTIAALVGENFDPQSTPAPVIALK